MSMSFRELSKDISKGGGCTAAGRLILLALSVVCLVGWIKRGPTGVISTNRPDGVAIAAHVAADFPDGSKPGREALTALLEERNVRVVSFDDWKAIEMVEEAGAAPPAPRRKIARIDEMLAVLKG